LDTLQLEELPAAEEVKEKEKEHGETSNASYDAAHDFVRRGILVRS
jgi:hypothetical protein